MAKIVLRDAKIWFAQYDLSAHHNSITLSVSKPSLDATSMGATWAGSLAGVPTGTISGGGYWDMTSPVSPDYEYWNSTIGATSKIISLSPDGGDAGEIAYTLQALNGEYACFGQYGDPAPFSLSATSDGAVVRGIVLGNGTATGTENGETQTYVAITSGQTLYGAIHVTAVSGFTSAVVKVQSDSDGLWTAGGTDRITFTTITGVTSEWKTYTTATTDKYWRYKISAMTGTSMTFAVVIGIV